MTITYLKKAEKQASTNDEKTSQIVSSMLAEIEKYGESAALQYSKDLDGFTGEVIVSREQIERAKSLISDELKNDIAFAYERVTNFAKAQRESISEFETEVFPGMWCAQKNHPFKYSRLLCTRWSLCPCCIGDYEYWHGKNRRG